MSGRPNKNTITLADFLRQPETPAKIDDTNVVGGNSHNNHNNHNNHNSQQPYTIRATKKGTVPCVVEKRKHHKVVVLSNIEGDVQALLSALQRALGTGGVVKGRNTIEIQGEHHLPRVEKFVLTTNCIQGASKTVKAQFDNNPQKNGVAKTNNVSKTTTTTTTKLDIISSSSSSPLDTKTIKAMKPTDLKKHLSARQLSIQGNKKELMARLIASMDKQHIA